MQTDEGSAKPDEVSGTAVSSEAPVRPDPPHEPPEVFPLAFTGSGREYFRIWIVNLALTVLTFGVYSAWAKVRRLQYFYRHTRLAGAGFDYHGNPVTILKGRIVGLGLFGLYSTAGYFHEYVAVAIFVGLALVLPWLLARSLKFRLYNSSYRGLRFQFDGATSSAYWVFLSLPVLTVLSLFTLGPLWHHRLKRYQHGQSSYGQTRLNFRTEVGEFYITYVVALFIAVGLVIAFTVLLVLAGVIIAMAEGPDAGPGLTPGRSLVVFGVMIVYVSVVLGLRAFTDARLQNAVWNRMRLGRHRFVCRIQPMRYFGIQVANVLATMATLGFYRPFAQVRVAAYLASVFSVVGPDAFHEFVASEQQAVAAVGEEAAEFFDFDIAF